MELINSVTSEAHKVLKYAPPAKFSVVNIAINGEAVEARVTSGRAKSYTYFPVKGVGHYVEGALAADSNFTLEVPEGDIKGPAWDGARKSYYVRKRPVKEKGEAQEGEANTDQDSGQDSTEASAGESAPADEAATEASAAPRSRRKRGE